MALNPFGVLERKILGILDSFYAEGVMHHSPGLGRSAYPGGK